MLSAFTAILLLSSVTRAVAASKPYAAYFDDEKTLYFVYKDSKSSGVDQIIEGKTATKVFSITSDDGTFAGCEGAEDATRVVIESSFHAFTPESCLNWFYGLCNVTEIEGLGNINTSSVITTNQMFRGCSSLTALDLSRLSFSPKLINMNGMFQDCSALTSLDISKFKTENVTTMRNMLNGCTSLTSLYLPNVIDNLHDNTDMFKDCNSLRLVDLSESVSESSVLKTFVNQIPGYPLIYVPESTFKDEPDNDLVNVVAGKVCDNLVIGDTDAGYRQLLLSVPYSFTATSVTVKRTFTADKPYTLYLPFAIDAAAYGTFYTGGELNENGTIVCFSKLDAGHTEANTPYLFVPGKNYAELTLDGPVAVAVTAALTETDGLNGVYEKKVFSAGDAARKLYYGWAGGVFRPALEGAVVDAGRAYFKLPASNASNAPATLKVRLGNDLSTGISDINCDAHATDSPTYNLNGQRVTDSYRGVVVRNGAKTLRR